RPPQLGAIVTVASTDDRYADDVHYMGGCLLGDNLSWASTMFAYNSCPPDPDLVPEWRQRWFERLEGSGLWLDQWLRHQRRDEYYRHGSICESYDNVQVPVLAVSGWADGYTNSVFRMLENLSAPCWGLIGPWGHTYPHIGSPGPAIGFLQEALRFWDRWLGREPNGYEAVPRLRAYVQDYANPAPSYGTRPGYWVALDSWPDAARRSLYFKLRPGRLVPAAKPAVGGGTANEAAGSTSAPVESVRSPLTLGQFAGKWCSYTATPDLPGDQREEDGGALVYESEPLEAAVEALGRPAVVVVFEATAPGGTVAIRLSDVAPTGEAYRVTYGVMNLTHYADHAEPRALVPGRRYAVEVALNGVGHRFPAGNRIRLAVSTSYWPLVWAPQYWEPLRLVPRDCHLNLPLAPVASQAPGGANESGLSWEPPEAAAPLERVQRTATESNWTLRRDLAADRSVVEIVKDDGRYLIPEIDLEISNAALERYEIQPGAPHSAAGTTRRVRSFSRAGWSVRTETRTTLTCDETRFIVDAELDAFEGARRVFSRNFRSEIPRDHV
ncbi:MAG: CocE/NonD family hydrolase, partial [Spirochaetota bacterium]